MVRIPVKVKLLPRKIREFIATESAGGVIMLIFAALALVAANSPLSEWYRFFISANISVGYEEHVFSEPLQQWVKDIFIVFFFLVVAMELKLEVCNGVLSNRAGIFLPMAAAIGGMLFPSLIFYGINHGHADNLKGWAIPSATDIAFALCVLMLAGKSVPSALKVFLLAIAIFDDLGAIVIIAAFYNTELSLIPLIMALTAVAMLILINRRNITSLSPYFLVGAYLWLCLYNSGIHTTIAGVAVGVAIPLRDKNRPRHSPLSICVLKLHPWISFLILPLFAFTSAGVSFSGFEASKLLDPLTLGITAGLFLGKQIGIFGVSWLMIKWSLAEKPEGTNWMHIYGVSVIAGIGFTMSLFIGLLAFPEAAMQDTIKIGVISGSLLSAAWGFVVLKYLAGNVRAGKKTSWATPS